VSREREKWGCTFLIEGKESMHFFCEVFSFRERLAGGKTSSHLLEGRPQGRANARPHWVATHAEIRVISRRGKDIDSTGMGGGKKRGQTRILTAKVASKGKEKKRHALGGASESEKSKLHTAFFRRHPEVTLPHFKCSGRKRCLQEAQREECNVLYKKER